MNSQPGIFGKGRRAAERPWLDATRLSGGWVSWLTPNRVVAGCRVLLVALWLAELIIGPDELGSDALRFGIAYGLTLTTIAAFPKIRGTILAGAVALLLGARWAFDVADGATARLLLMQLTGIICAVTPIYVLHAVRLSGSWEGHISFVDRHALWRRQSADRARSSSSPAPQSPAASSAVALIAYHPTDCADAASTSLR